MFRILKMFSFPYDLLLEQGWGKLSNINASADCSCRFGEILHISLRLELPLIRKGMGAMGKPDSPEALYPSHPTPPLPFHDPRPVV